MRKILIFILFILSLSAKELVAVSILPQEFLVEKIADSKIDVLTLVKPGNSPHTYEPKPSQMVKLSKAKGYFAIGVEFENVWLDRFKSQNSDLKIFNSDKNITKLLMGKGGKRDPHIWLDPINLKVISKNIAQGLIEIDESNKELYLANLEKLNKELDELDAKIKETLKDIKQRDFLVFHPSWGYFAKRYNLNQIPIEIEGKEPSFKELIAILNDAKKRGIKIIFTQPEFSQKQAKLIAKELGIRLVPISPMKKDIFENMLFMANEIAKANR